MRFRLPGGFLRSAAVGLLAVGAAAAFALPEGIATAKSDGDSPYGYERTWNATLRYVRVDLGLKVLEKDEQSGYLLFEYRSPESGPKATSGSFEVVRGPRDSNNVKIVVQIPQMPRYHEQAMLDGLTHKMHDEYGEPPPAHRDAPDAPPPDAGSDANDEYFDNEHIIQ